MENTIMNNQTANIAKTEVIAMFPEYVHTDRAAYEFVKRCGDFLLSLLLFFAISPVMLIIMLTILAVDRVNPIYKARRMGKSGKSFYIYKFRTMKKGAEHLENFLTEEQIAEYRKTYKLEYDPRVTRLGNILRRTSLDELPQLLNILKGDMSIVGPRPVLEEETQLYGKNRGTLLSVRPGLTGYWQVHGRNNVTYETGERQHMELTYVSKRGISMDIKIIVKTIITVIKKDGAL